METIALHSAVTLTSSQVSMPKGSARAMRRADSLTRMAVAAVMECLDQVTSRAGNPDIVDYAICAGLGAGTIESNLAFVESVFSNRDMCGSPTLFSHSVHNTIAGYISRIAGIYGPTFTLSDFTWPFISALQQAQCIIQARMAPAVMVLSCEKSCRFLQDVMSDMMSIPADDSSLSPVATAWLVAAEGVIPAPFVKISHLNISAYACRPEELLLRFTEKCPGNGLDESWRPGRYLVSLAAVVNEVFCNRRDAMWHVSADFGSASVEFQCA